MVEVKEVTTRADWKRFAKFPVDLYKDVPQYVPVFLSDDVNMANPKKNFSAQNCDVKAFLAYKDGKLAGRIAGIIVRQSNQKFNEKAIRFSRFDFVEDIEVARALLDAVADFGRSLGMDRLHGPWGFNDTDREGMLTFGFDKMGSYATNYNYAYYPEFMQKLGYATESVWIEEKIVAPKPGSRKYERYMKLGKFVKQKYNLIDIAETMSVKQVVKRYGDKFFDCYNNAYKHLDMYVPIEGDAKKAVLKQFATIINPKFFSVLVDQNDQVVAFCVLLPAIGPAIKKHGGKGNIFALLDVLKLINNPDTLELTLGAASPEYAKRGYAGACIAKLLRDTTEAGIVNFVSDPTLESNTAIRALWSQVESTEVIKNRQTYTIKI